MLAVGAGRNPQVSAVGHNGANGDRRQREHGTQHRYQVWNSQTRRRLSCTRRTRVQPEDTRNYRWTGEMYGDIFNYALYESTHLLIIPFCRHARKFGKFGNLENVQRH